LQSGQPVTSSSAGDNWCPPHSSTDLSAVNRFSPAGQDWIIGLLARALGGRGPRGEDYGDPRRPVGLVESREGHS